MRGVTTHLVWTYRATISVHLVMISNYGSIARHAQWICVVTVDTVQGVCGWGGGGGGVWVCVCTCLPVQLFI